MRPQISRLNSKYVLHRLKRAWWIPEFRQPEEKKLLSSPSAWRKTLHASYSRQQWDEQGALEVGGCLLRTSDVLDSFNYLQHSFNVLGLVGAQTSPSRCHFRFTFGTAFENQQNRGAFFCQVVVSCTGVNCMHSAQGGTCRIKIQAEQDPFNKYSCIEKKNSGATEKFENLQQTLQLQISHLHFRAYTTACHVRSPQWLLQGFVKNVLGRREWTSLSSNSPFRLQSRPDLQRADSSVSGYLASRIVFWASDLLRRRSRWRCSSKRRPGHKAVQLQH